MGNVQSKAMQTDLTGHILIAMPSIGDPRFDRAVILLCAHSDEYAMGIVLNKPMQGVVLPDLLEQLGVPLEISVPQTSVLDGGPVSGDRGFVLHSDDARNSEATLEISDGLCMTATRDILLKLGTRKAPRQSVLALGYAGWGAGQLEIELADNAWLVAPMDENLVFGDSHNSKWNLALDLIGVDSGLLQARPGHA